MKDQELPHKSEQLKHCVFCNKGFSKTYSLSRHLQLHTGAKPYECHICSYGFIQKTDLHRHLATHVDEFNFTCNVQGCAKIFRTKRNLRTHQTSIHSNRGVYPCPRCGKVFEVSGSLRIHMMKQHDKDYDYRCDYCGKGFPEKHHLHSHFRLVKKNSADVYRVRCISSIKQEGVEFRRKLAIAKKPTAARMRHKISPMPLETSSKSSGNKHVGDHEFLMSFLHHLGSMNQKSKSNFKKSVHDIIRNVLKIKTK